MNHQRQDLYRYVVEEFAEDYHEGEIDRREFLRRISLLGGGTAGARALLTSLGIAGVTAAELAQAQEAIAQAAPPVGGEPQVAPNDPAIRAENLNFEARGLVQQGYLAAPASGATGPGVLVIHENRGLQPHIQDVARRLARAGYVALAPDLVAKLGGTARFTDTAQISTFLAQTSPDEHIANLLEHLERLKKHPQVAAGKLGAVGFCFGGGLTWRLATAAPELKAAVPFYGPAPDLAQVPKIRAAVLGIYGATDTRINAGIPALEDALKAARTTYRIRIYEGAGHAFHNDTGANYRKEAALDAWQQTLDWLRTYL